MLVSFYQVDKTTNSNNLKAAESSETLDQSTEESDQTQVSRPSSTILQKFRKKTIKIILEELEAA